MEGIERFQTFVQGIDSFVKESRIFAEIKSKQIKFFNNILLTSEKKKKITGWVFSILKLTKISHEITCYILQAVKLSLVWKNAQTFHS